MPKTFVVKMPSVSTTRAGEYVVVTCPKCGKKTYGVAGQKGKKCLVCRRQFPMPPCSDAPRFQTPEEACRFIQAEEAKRAGRLDFALATGGFRPSASHPVIARADKVVSGIKTLEAQFMTWVRNYLRGAPGRGTTGIPTTVVIAAAVKAGFANPDKFIEKAIAAGILVRPKPYSLQLNRLGV